MSEPEMEVRHAAAPEDIARATTDELRARFLVQGIFPADRARLVYSHIDRLILGGAMPVHEAGGAGRRLGIGTPFLLSAREMGIANLGGPARVTVDGQAFELARRDVLYVGRGSRVIRLESRDPAAPAKLFDRDMKARGFWRAVFFFPVLLSPVVVGLIWKWILQRDGVLNAILVGLGFDRINWLADPGWPCSGRPTSPDLAHRGLYALILVAGLQAIPEEIYEAAEIDGTGPVRVLRRIVVHSAHEFPTASWRGERRRQQLRLCGCRTVAACGWRDPGAADRALPALVDAAACQQSRSGSAAGRPAPAPRLHRPAPALRRLGV